MKIHLAVLRQEYLNKILDGSKTIESRLSLIPCPPYKAIDKGDIIFFKASGGAVCACAEAFDIKYFSNLAPAAVEKIKEQYNDKICGNDDYWQIKSASRYATLIFLEKIKRLEPVWIEKKDYRSWVVLKEPNDFGLCRLAFSCNIIDQS